MTVEELKILLDKFDPKQEVCIYGEDGFPNFIVGIRSSKEELNPEYLDKNTEPFLMIV